MTTETNIPALAGIDKQIAWADEIRAKHIALFAKDVKLQGFLFSPAELADYQQRFQAILESKTQASFWINCRSGVNIFASIVDGEL